jgi:DNA replication factor GINS
MRYDDLVRILEEEEKKSTLSSISVDFYKELNDYIKEMENEETKISRKYSEAAIQIQYELKNAFSIVDKLFKKRTRKIIKMASGKAFSKNPLNITRDIVHMTPQERDIYHQVLDAILLGKKNTIEPILGADIDGISNIDRTSSNGLSDNETSNQAAQQLNIPLIEDNITVQDENGTKDISKEYIVVRILKDIPTFIGTDGRHYMLNAQDIANLPKINAQALIKRKVAGQINII